MTNTEMMKLIDELFKKANESKECDLLIRAANALIELRKQLRDERYSTLNDDMDYIMNVGYSGRRNTDDYG